MKEEHETDKQLMKEGLEAEIKILEATIQELKLKLSDQCYDAEKNLASDFEEHFKQEISALREALHENVFQSG